MLLTGLKVDGLRAAPEAHVDTLDGSGGLPAGPEGVSLVDGLALAAAALRPEAAPLALRRLGWAGPDTTWTLDLDLLDEVEALDPHGVDASVAPSPVARHVTIHLDLVPDPPMYRRLRDRAGRDPQLLAALSSGAHLHLRVGWLLNRAGSHASVAALALRVGDERFATGAAERPDWMVPLLREIGSRLVVHDPDATEAEVAAALHAAALSPEPERRAAFEHARTLLSAPDLLGGALQLVLRGGRVQVAVGEALVPLRAHGPAGLRAVRLALDAVVRAPDLLVVEDPEPWRAWLLARAEGDDATLEQVLWLETP